MMSAPQQVSRIRLVSRSAPTRRVERDALLAARGDANILIVGEGGPVKAALARFVHEQSDRSSQGFSILRCDRLTDELVRFELFGSIAKPGLLTSARCGTVFLDEIGALGAATQARLLRYLDEIDRPASSDRGRSTGQPSVRLIASTSVSLNAQVAAGLFLPDLYYRLSAVTLAVPTQHERRNDLRELQISA